MRLFFRFLFFGTLIGIGLLQPASSQEGEDRRVTYIEVSPSATELTAGLLRSYAESGVVAPGNQMLRVLQRIGRANHFVVLESWNSEEAQTSHADSDYALEFYSALKPLLLSPPDTRFHNELSTAPATSVGPGAVFVVTHVDVVPPYTETAVELVSALASAGRGEEGNARFDVWSVSGRPNHMTVIEAWQNAALRERHTTSVHTRGFRSSLSPLNGALYDERLYRAF